MLDYSDLQNLQVGRAQTTGSRQKLLMLATKSLQQTEVWKLLAIIIKHVEDDSISIILGCKIYARICVCYMEFIIIDYLITLQKNCLNVSPNIVGK